MSFNRIYIVDYNKLALLLLPTFLRGRKTAAWLEALVTPIKKLHTDFLNYRKKANYRLAHNSQVCYLEKVLNDAFDRELKRVYIENSILLQPLYVYALE